MHTVIEFITRSFPGSDVITEKLDRENIRFEFGIDVEKKGEILESSICKILGSEPFLYLRETATGLQGFACWN